MVYYSRWNTGCCCKKIGCADCVEDDTFRCPPQTAAVLYYGPYDAERFAEIKAQTDGVYWMPILYSRYENGEHKYRMAPAYFPGWAITFGRGTGVISVFNREFQTSQTLLNDTTGTWVRGVLIDEEGPCDGIHFQKYINMVRDNILAASPTSHKIESIIYAYIIHEWPETGNLDSEHRIYVYRLGNLCRDGFPPGPRPENSTYLIAMFTLCVDENGRFILHTPETDLSISLSAWSSSDWNRENQYGNNVLTFGDTDAGIVYDPTIKYEHESEYGFTEIFPISTPWRKYTVLNCDIPISGTLTEHRTESEVSYYDNFNYTRYTLSNRITARYNYIPDFLSLYLQNLHVEDPESLFRNPEIVKELYKKIEMQFVFHKRTNEDFPIGPYNSGPGYTIPLTVYHSPNIASGSDGAITEITAGINESVEKTGTFEVEAFVMTDFQTVPSRESVFSWLNECMDNYCSATGRVTALTSVLGHEYCGQDRGEICMGSIARASAPALMRSSSSNTLQIDQEESLRTLTVNDLLIGNCRYAHDTGEAWISNVSCTAIECSHPNGPSLGIYSSSTRYPTDSEGDPISDSGIVLVRSKYCNSRYCQNYQ